MGLMARLANWFKRSDQDPDAWAFASSAYSIPSVTGIKINQVTALNSSAVAACVMMLAEDVAKLPWSLYRNAENEARKEEQNHPLYDLLQEPNEWMNGLEFREMLQCGLVLRGNAYAIVRRNLRGVPIALLPWNPDRTYLWVAGDGKLFYRFTPSGFHEMALLKGMPDLIPAEDVFHIRGFSLNGLLGASRIVLMKEAIGLGLAQEQTAARWMGNGARPSGMFTTDSKLGDDVAERLKKNIKESFGGLQNSGKIMLGEQGLKFQPLAMTSSDLEFLASRKFQLEEVARIFRIPLHMLGELTRSTNNNIAQQAQEYINYTLTGYTNRWRAKMSSCFGLRKLGLSVEFDYRELTTADMTTRINNWRAGIMSMIFKPDEARIDLGYPAEGGEAEKLHFPQNMAALGSQSTGTQPDGGGRPSEQDGARFVNGVFRLADGRALIRGIWQ